MSKDNDDKSQQGARLVTSINTLLPSTGDKGTYIPSTSERKPASPPPQPERK